MEQVFVNMHLKNFLAFADDFVALTVIA